MKFLTLLFFFFINKKENSLAINYNEKKKTWTILTVAKETAEEIFQHCIPIFFFGVFPLEKFLTHILKNIYIFLKIIKM